MKNILRAILFTSITLTPLLTKNGVAQNATVPQAFSVEGVTLQHPQTGNKNYMASLSDADFKNRKYVFYTDSNATVAYVNINGTVLRMTGGENGEHIMAYSTKGYTATLSAKTKTPMASGNADDHSAFKITGVLTIYKSDGKMVVKNISGQFTNAVKN